MFTEQDYKQRYDELKKVHIQLSSDPISEGVSALNGKIAEIQSQKDFISLKFVEAIRNKTECEIFYKSKKQEYEAKVAHLKVHDPTVMSQKSDSARTSSANVKLAEDVLQVYYYEKALLQAETYYKVVGHIWSNLESVNNNLSRQITVTQMSMQLGEISRGSTQPQKST